MVDPTFRLLEFPAGLREGTERLLGVTGSGMILFTAGCAPAVTAASLSPGLFDEVRAELDGISIRLRGLATLQDSACGDAVVVRLHFSAA